MEKICMHLEGGECCAPRVLGMMKASGDAMKESGSYSCAGNGLQAILQGFNEVELGIF
jgi:hypothetical protein